MTAKQLANSLQAPDGSYYVTLTDGNGTLAPASSSGETSTNLTQVGGAAVALGQTTKSASIPVTLASDTGTLPVSLTSTTVTGTVAVSMTSPTTTFRLLSATGSSGDANNVKNASGTLFGIQGANVATSARYLKIYNTSSAPTAGSGTPIKTLYIPASSAFVFDFFRGYTFATGIGFTLVTGSADNNSTSVTAGDILALNIDYA